MAKSFESGPKSNPDKNNEEILWHGVRKAQEIARQEGLKIGQTVAHPDDKMTYALKEIKGDIAVVWLPGQEDTAKEFPLNELSDPNIVKREAVQKKFDQDLFKKHLEINN